MGLSNVYKLTWKDFFSRKRTIVFKIGTPLYLHERFSFKTTSSGEIINKEEFTNASDYLMKKISELIVLDHKQVTQPTADRKLIST